MIRFSVYLLSLFIACAAHSQGINHQPFDEILRAAVKDGQVNYPLIQENKNFKPYVDEFAKKVELNSKTDKLVYYMNAYNALAIQGILEGLSPSSFFGRARYFKGKDWQLNGQSINLYDLEHKLIRPLGEPRIHFTIICASKSCPKLRAEVYTPAKLESQLEENAKLFVNDTFRNRFDKQKKVAYLSEIFKWFDEDFIASSGTVQKYIARYVADPEIAKELAADAYKIEYISYDWNLNGIPPKKS